MEAKNQTLDDIVTYIAQTVADRAADGNNFGTVLIPEGLIEFIPAMKKLIAELNDLLATPEAENLPRKISVNGSWANYRPRTRRFTNPCPLVWLLS